MLLWPIVALPYDLRNSSVFSARLNAPSDGSDVIAGGSAFQIFAAAPGKARSPMVLCNDRGTCSTTNNPNGTTTASTFLETKLASGYSKQRLKFLKYTVFKGVRYNRAHGYTPEEKRS